MMAGRHRTTVLSRRWLPTQGTSWAGKASKCTRDRTCRPRTPPFFSLRRGMQTWRGAQTPSITEKCNKADEMEYWKIFFIPLPGQTNRSVRLLGLARPVSAPPEGGLAVVRGFSRSLANHTPHWLDWDTSNNNRRKPIPHARHALTQTTEGRGPKKKHLTVPRPPLFKW